MKALGLLPFVEVRAGAVDQRRVFGVRQDVVQSGATGREMQVDRLVVPDWVNVIALAGDDMLFVRQWRFGSRTFTLEIPAGTVEPGEAALAAGLRELREETGYAPADPARVRAIGVVRPNPAFMQNVCTTLLVEDAVLVGTPEPDATEELELVRVPRSEVTGLVRDGTLDNALVVAALHWLALADAPR